jgi:UDP-GlcNAc:undecaprenyl-phosphate GlcNAc-1-phosphate transferase
MRFPEALFALAFVAGGLVSLVLTPLVRWGAVAWGVLDIPDGRKIHRSPVPRLGGVAVGAGVALGVTVAFASSPTLRSALFADSGWQRWIALATASLVILVTGSLDDVRGLTARTKLLLEVAAATVVVLVARTPAAVALGPSTGAVSLGVLGPVLGVVWIVGLANAVNMTDVADGVAGGIGAIAAFWLAMVCLALDRTVAAVVLLALAGALLGFLPHNFRRARMFLGDSGSLVIGFLLGAASLVGLERNGTWLVLPAALALGMPIAECGLTVARRALAALRVERSPTPREHFVLHAGDPGLFVPDARHIPHRLLRLGLSQRAALALLYGITAVLGALAVAAVQWPWFGLWSGVAAAAALLYAAARWWYDELRLVDRGALLPLFDNRMTHSRAVHQLYDGAAVAAAFLAARALIPTDLSGAAARAGSLGTGVAVAVLAVGAFGLAGLYGGSYLRSGVPELVRAVRATAVGVLAAGLIWTLAFGASWTAAGWLLFFYFALTAVVSARLLFRLLDYVHQRAENGRRHAVIVGAGRGGELALRAMLADPALGFAPVGFLDDDPQVRGIEVHGYPVLGATTDLAGALSAGTVHDVVVATSKLDRARLDAIAATCRARGVRMLQFDLHWRAVEPVAQGGLT